MPTLAHNRFVARPSATLQPLVITTASLPGATIGSAYSTTLAATGGQGPYTWSILSAVPNTASWLSITSVGVLSGTPGTAETETVLVQVIDAIGTKASGFLSITVVSGSSTTDLTKLFRWFDYDARTTGSTPSDTGVSYWDSPVVDAVNTWTAHKSVKHTLAGPAGSQGPFGDEWDHTIFPVDPDLVVGDELWVARSLWVSSTFDYTAGSNLKWLRLANWRTSVSANNGWLDFYITDTTGSMKHQNEFGVVGGVSEDFSAQSDTTLKALNWKFPKNQWVVFQAYAKFSTTAGQGIVRAWADNTPIYENTSFINGVAGARVFYTYWQNFWNGTGLPAGNVGNTMASSRAAMAVKSAALARDDRSFLATDSRGNLYIKMV